MQRKIGNETRQRETAQQKASNHEAMQRLVQLEYETQRIRELLSAGPQESAEAAVDRL